MKLKKITTLFSLMIAISTMLVSSCSLLKEKPDNVRELMESDGWEYCGLKYVDAYFDKRNHSDGSVIEAWIYENGGNYDLFKRGEELCLTRTHTDQISLSNYDGDDEHMRSSYWINYYAIMGDYTLRADHARKGTGRLGMITKRYNAKTVSNSGSALYFVVTSQSVPSHDYNSDVLNNDYESSYEDEDEPTKKYKQCPLCHGTTRCGGCGGSGLVYNSIDYSSGQYIECSSCGGSGECGLCEGTGSVEDFGW